MSDTKNSELANIPVSEMTREQAMQRVAELQRKYDQVQQEVMRELEEVCDAHQLHAYVGDYGYGMTYVPKQEEPDWWSSSDGEWESSDYDAGRWVSSSENC